MLMSQHQRQKNPVTHNWLSPEGWPAQIVPPGGWRTRQSGRGVVGRTMRQEKGCWRWMRC